MTQEVFLATNWKIGDRFYGCWHWFEITAIHKKSWGRIPMTVTWFEGNSRPDVLCVGVNPVDQLATSITPDYDRGPDSCSIVRVFREGVEIWRDENRLKRWPEKYAIQDGVFGVPKTEGPNG